MKRYSRLLQVGALAVVLGASGLPAAAQHTDRRGAGGGGDQGAAQPRGGGGADRGGGGQAQRGRSSDGGSRVESAPPANNGNGNARARGDGGNRQRPETQAQRPSDQRASGSNGRDQRASGNNNGGGQRADGYAYPNNGRDRNDGRDTRASGGNSGAYSGGSNNGPAGPGNRGYAQRRDPRDGSYYYGASRSWNPRTAPRGWTPRRFYGSGGPRSVFFGWGSGYRYGSPYYGRIYGYSAPVTVYGSARRYYGDVRLQVNPRWAEVYVDGYYAGTVDEFDGFFQRLTIEVGPHEIEVTAPGYESQFFDIYVDPERTIELRGDLYPLR